MFGGETDLNWEHLEQEIRRLNSGRLFVNIARAFTWSAALPCPAGTRFEGLFAMFPVYCSTVARNLAIDLSH